MPLNRHSLIQVAYTEKICVVVVVAVIFLPLGPGGF